MAGNDSYTKLLLHCNGVDASTTFTDDSGSAHAVTAVNNAQIDTAQSVFGGASGLFDGTGDYLSIPDHADWDFGTGDFTLDLWVRFNSYTGTQRIFSQRTELTTFWELVKYDTNKLQLHAVVAGVNRAVYVMTSAYSWNNGQWYHIAAVRSGTNIYIFIDGVSQALTVTQAISTNAWVDATVNLNIGAYHDAWVTDNSFNGWMDEIRISKGIARWTSNFTLPTEEYNEFIDVSKSKALLYSYGSWQQISKSKALLYDYHGWTTLLKSKNLLYDYRQVLKKSKNLLYDYRKRIRKSQAGVYDYLPRTPQAMWIESPADWSPDSCVVRWKYVLPTGFSSERQVSFIIYLDGNKVDETFGNNFSVTADANIPHELYVWAKVRPGQKYTAPTPIATKAKITFDVDDSNDIMKVEIFTDHGYGTLITDDVYATIVVEDGVQYFGKKDVYNRTEISV